MSALLPRLHSRPRSAVHLELLAKQKVSVESRVVNATVRILKRDRCLDGQLGCRHRVGATVEVDQRRSGLPLGDMALDHVQERADVGSAIREIDSDRKGVVLLDHLGTEGCERVVEVVCRLGRACSNRERAALLVPAFKPESARPPSWSLRSFANRGLQTGSERRSSAEIPPVVKTGWSRRVEGLALRRSCRRLGL